MIPIYVLVSISDKVLALRTTRDNFDDEPEWLLYPLLLFFTKVRQPFGDYCSCVSTKYWTWSVLLYVRIEVYLTSIIRARIVRVWYRCWWLLLVEVGEKRRVIFEWPGLSEIIFLQIICCKKCCVIFYNKVPVMICDYSRSFLLSFRLAPPPVCTRSLERVCIRSRFALIVFSSGFAYSPRPYSFSAEGYYPRALYRFSSFIIVVITGLLYQYFIMDIGIHLLHYLFSTTNWFSTSPSIIIYH